MLKNNIFKKSMAVAVICLFIIIGVIPGISENIKNQEMQSESLKSMIEKMDFVL